MINENNKMIGMLSLTLDNTKSLYAAYMPYVLGGGLFIPTTKSYSLGDKLLIKLSLMNEATHIPLGGQVIWITPNSSQGNLKSGIGIKILDETGTVRNKIETYLVGKINANTPSFTI